MTKVKGSQEVPDQEEGRRPTPEENLAQEVTKRYSEMFPGSHTVTLLDALNMLIARGGGPLSLEEINQKIAASGHADKPPLYTKFTGGKTVADISDVPDRPSDVAHDNWIHRSQKMMCKTCMWYVPKGNGAIGRCRHSAPTMKGWPAMFPTDWCGCHKLDETKL